MNLFLQGGLLDHSVKQDLDLGLQYEDVQYDTARTIPILGCTVGVRVCTN